METERVLFRKIYINSSDASNIDTAILSNLKKDIEGKCTADGYIKEIKQIVNRTRGHIDVNDLAGSIVYDVSFKTDVINLEKHDIIVGAIVTLVTSAGIFLEKNGFIRIFVSSDYIDDVKKYNINDMMHILVLGSECGIQKPKIIVIGKPHLYYIPMENERLLTFPPHEFISLIKTLKITLTNIKNDIKNCSEYGYNVSIDMLKGMIDDIDPKIWRFYRSLLNPSELIFPPISYSNFNVNPDNDIIPSRAYYKLWEILHKFSDVFSTDSIKNAVVLNLCENPGGFIKALIDFRNNKNDKFNLVSLDNDIKVSDKLINKFKSQIKTYKLDIIKYESLKKLDKEFHGKCNIITADGGIKLPEGQYDEEIELGLLKYAEVIIALTCQTIGGSLVLKLFESCSQLTIDLIYLIYQCYTEVVIYKPITSRPASSERYLVAINFKGIDKKLLEQLHKVLNEPKLVYIASIFSKIGDYAYLNLIKTINYRLQSNQIKKLKEMIDMIILYNGNRPPKEEVDKLVKEQEKIAVNWALENNLRGKK